MKVTMEVDDLPPRIQPFFKSPVTLCYDTMDAWKFQEDNFERLLDHLQKKTTRQHQILLKARAEMQNMKVMKSEIKALKEENEMLKRVLKQHEQSRGQGSSNIVPTVNQDLNHRHTILDPNPGLPPTEPASQSNGRRDERELSKSMDPPRTSRHEHRHATERPSKVSKNGDHAGIQFKDKEAVVNNFGKHRVEQTNGARSAASNTSSLKSILNVRSVLEEKKFSVKNTKKSQADQI
ncbi:hypothetical protein BGZ83_011711 [Gryganskiella cystojenkinii]|nr:hypothetical protein BGZ83_011711 [Gryganskiella cystojenkinii]